MSQNNTDDLATPIANWRAGRCLTQDNVRILPLHLPIHRKHPRMRYSGHATIRTKGSMPARARMLDVSAGGFQLKTKDPIRLTVGQRVYVFLPSLYQRLDLVPRENVCEVVHILKLNDMRTIGFRFVDLEPRICTALQDFIEQHKHKYKLDVTDVLDNLYQQRLAWLHDKGARFVSAMQADNADSGSPIRLLGVHQSLPSDWIDAAISDACVLPEDLTSKTASNPDVIPIDGKHGFWLCCPNVAVDANPSSDESENLENLDPRALEEIVQWKALALWLPSWPPERRTIPDENQNQPPIPKLLLDQTYRRDEHRYRLNLRVFALVRGVEYAGETVDVSVNGLKIVFQEAVRAQLRDLVEITFVRLQQRYPKVNLTRQPYRVTAVSPDGLTLSLTRDFRFLRHDAARFFSKLLPENKDKLDACPDDTYFDDLRKTYCSILEKYAPALMGVILGRGNKARWTDLAYTDTSKDWLNHLMKDGSSSLAFLTRGRAWHALRNHITTIEDDPFDAELYLASNKTTPTTPSWQARWSFEFESPKSRQTYVRQTASSALMLCFRVLGGLAPSPDLKSAQGSLNRLRHHSPKAHRDFLQENRETAFCVHFIEMTDCIVSRDAE